MILFFILWQLSETFSEYFLEQLLHHFDFKNTCTYLNKFDQRICTLSKCNNTFQIAVII